MNKKKQGQLLTQPLFYILAMVVGALILLFGYRVITGIMETSQQVTLQKWTNDFDHKVKEAFFLDVGSTSLINIQLPQKIQYACIKSGDDPQFPPYVSATDRALMTANTGKNLIFLPVDAFNQGTFVTMEHLTAPTDFLCFRNGAQAILESKGDHVELHN